MQSSRLNLLLSRVGRVQAQTTARRMEMMRSEYARCALENQITPLESRASTRASSTTARRMEMVRSEQCTSLENQHGATPLGSRASTWASSTTAKRMEMMRSATGEWCAFLEHQHDMSSSSTTARRMEMVRSATAEQEGKKILCDVLSSKGYSLRRRLLYDCSPLADDRVAAPNCTNRLIKAGCCSDKCDR